MTNWLLKKNYTIFIYAKEDIASYDAAIKALRAVNAATKVYDRIHGVTVLEDCRIPRIYHGDNLAIICERDKGSGEYSCKYMSESN